MRNSKSPANGAVVYSAKQPSAGQMQKLSDFVEKKYGKGFRLSWRQDDALTNGFRLVVGESVYDWSPAGRMRQLERKLEDLRFTDDNVIPLLKTAFEDWSPRAISEETGTVETVGDGIATVSGLPDASYGEVLVFQSGVRGMVQDLKRDRIGCILFGDGSDVLQGSSVHRTGRTAGIPVGDAMIGRVINALGAPIDGKGAIEEKDYRPIEMTAPGIIERQPVNRPMETGLLAIDSMFPIGRGQRELIIGDRQTGKTAIAVDTIINQRDKDVICVYVAIGQKASSVAQLAETLRSHGAMKYTVIVCATASDPAPLQYIAPYAGCALGEYFMERGRDVLIVYDDLSKHAIAYRELSLLLERSPGREAYPGDVFYLHSRLLERAAHLSDEKGGGSMTALPIVETQSGDVSAYIPTNIISITDGQIFLESNLFFSGQRPAVNVGLSVSRVGGNAQTKAMKSAVGSLRLDLAQYREIEVFTRFASDLDDATKKQLVYGSGLMQLLKQDRCSPLKQYEQVIILVAAMEHIFESVPTDEITGFRSGLLRYIAEKAPDISLEIDKTNQLSDGLRKDIVRQSKEYLEHYKKGIAK